MWSKIQRTDVDNVESDFVSFKNSCPERDEELIRKVVCERFSCPPLIDATSDAASSLDIDALAALGPWGYSFRITDSLTAYDLDRRCFDNLPAFDYGLAEMDLRISILESIFREHSQPNDSWADLATNCGIIPILLSKKRLFNVTGIDINQSNINKANALKYLGNSPNVMQFLACDAFGFLDDKKDSFDIISALGLFYHLSDPLGLLFKIYNATKRIAIIDTVIHNFPFSGWIQTVSRHVKYEHLGHANDTRKIIELHPTYRGLVDALYQVGFNSVIEYTPSSQLLESCPSDIYRTRNRVMFVALK